MHLLHQCLHQREALPASSKTQQRLSRVLPVTAASPAHSCGGRQAAGQPVLAAFSHTAPFNQSLGFPHKSGGLLLPASTLALKHQGMPKISLSLQSRFLWAPLVNWAGGGAARGRRGRVWLLGGWRIRYRKRTGGTVMWEGKSVAAIADKF